MSKDEGYITLHPTQGVNCHMCFCRRCGGDSPELMLIGDKDSIYQCGSCGISLIGYKAIEKCGKCGHSGPHKFLRKIEERERLPGGLCNKCEKEIKEHAEIVKAGGIYFKCKECSQSGVIKGKSGLAKAVRKQMKIKAPDPVGIEFDKCEQHTPKS